MKRFVTAVALVALFGSVMLPATVQAQPQHRPMGHMGPIGERIKDLPTTPILNMLDKRLSLSPEQKGKIEQVLAEAREGLKGPMQESRAVLQKTREGVLAVLNDEQKAKLKATKQDFLAALGGFAQVHGPALREGVQGATEELRTRMALNSLNLTPEQRQKLQEVQKSMREKHEALMKEMRPKLEQLKKDAQEQMNGVLTEEQRQQLKEKLEKMPKPGKALMHEGKPGHGPKPHCPATSGTLENK